MKKHFKKQNTYARKTLVNASILERANISFFIKHRLFFLKFIYKSIFWSFIGLNFFNLLCHDDVTRTIGLKFFNLLCHNDVTRTISYTIRKGILQTCQNNFHSVKEVTHQPVSLQCHYYNNALLNKRRVY